MRKFLLAAAAFVISALAGVVLLIVGSIVLPLLALRHASGIGAIAGGVSETAVYLVAILCGLLGTALAIRRLDRP